MGHSFISLGKNVERFHDDHLCAAICVLVDVARRKKKHPGNYEKEYWGEFERWLETTDWGPGMVDLRLDRVVQTPEQRRRTLEIVQEAEDLARQAGEEMPGDFFNTIMNLKGYWKMAPSRWVVDVLLAIRRMIVADVSS